jgi:hypothetical protein
MGHDQYKFSITGGIQKRYLQTEYFYALVEVHKITIFKINLKP